MESMRDEEQTLLKMDVDNALKRLTPQMRDILTARFLTGESAAEIGRRYGRTEQTISAWVREAVQQMKVIARPRFGPDPAI
jgi:RNA polymerase sigma factor (sigma-70 family)